MRRTGDRRRRLAHNLARGLAAGLLGLLLSQHAAAQLIVAHRGASADAPENTLAAFRLAWEQGADAIEGDFYLTRDNRIACIHDKDTERTAGVNISVAKSTLSELQKLDVGSWKDKKFAGERIATLEDVLDTVPDGKKIFIEIKCGPEIVPALKQVVQSTHLKPEQMVVISFQDDVIAETKKQLPQIKAHWLTSYKRDDSTGRWSPTIESVLKTLKRIGADGLDTKAHPPVINEDFVRQLRAAEMEFHCWTVDDPALAMRMRALGVDSITTNKPRSLRDQIPTAGIHQALRVHLRLDGTLANATGEFDEAEWVGTNRAVPFQPAVFDRGLGAADKAGHVAVPYRLPERGSFAVWYFARDWYDYQTIVDNSTHRDAWELWIDATGRAKFRVNPSGTVVAHDFHPTGDVNEWHHFVVTWDRSDKTADALKLYVNGRLSVAAGWRVNAQMPSGNQMFLGGGNSGNMAGRGMWDDFAVFNRVLSPADVRQLMRHGVDSLRPSELTATRSR